MRHILFLVAWTVVIIGLGILPLRNFVGHSHWEFIKWMPTIDDLQSPKYLVEIVIDVAGNTLLFTPFGYLINCVSGSRARAPGRQLLLAGCAGILLSCSIEYYQVYCHNRFPSLFDVVTNTSGSLLGARIAWLRGQAAPDDLRARTASPASRAIRS
ncbi:VanZ family protein [Nitrospira sp. KM1]|uniref:VanZ family protein n=1 Tax=Nitrospira sp. KM1 TaxID=1936990 RepID=UPI0015644262|nr:VanZ family protein [Nitrospira sp. KM1]